MALTERIQTLAAKKGLSIAALERELGFGNGTIRKWNENIPSADKLLKLANFLNTSTDWLLKGEDIHNSNIEEHALLDGYTQLEGYEKALILERVQTILDIKEATKKEETERKAQEVAQKKVVTPVVQAEPDDEEPEMVEMPVYEQKASAGLGVGIEEYLGYETLSFRRDGIPRRADFGMRIDGDSMAPDIKDGQIVWVKSQPNVGNGQIGIFVVRKQGEDEEAYCKRLLLLENPRRAYLVSDNPKYKKIRVYKEDYVRTIGIVLG